MRFCWLIIIFNLKKCKVNIQGELYLNLKKIYIQQPMPAKIISLSSYPPTAKNIVNSHRVEVQRSIENPNQKLCFHGLVKVYRRLTRHRHTNRLIGKNTALISAGFSLGICGGTFTV